MCRLRSRSRRNWRRVWWITVAISLLAGGGVLARHAAGRVEFWPAFVAWSFVSLAIASYAASVATAPVKVVVADQSRGIVRMRFRNPDYHPSFIQ